MLDKNPTVTTMPDMITTKLIEKEAAIKEPILLGLFSTLSRLFLGDGR